MDTRLYYVVSYIAIRLSDFNQSSSPSYCDALQAWGEIEHYEITIGPFETQDSGEYWDDTSLCKWRPHIQPICILSCLSI